MNTKEYRKNILAVLTGTALAITPLNTFAVSAEAEAAEKESVFLGESIVTLGDSGYSEADVLSMADKDFIFRNQLDVSNTNAYDAMTEYSADPSDTTLTISLEDEIVLARSSRNMSNWSDEEMTEYANAVLEAVMPGVVCFTLDNPEVFWINFAEVGCGLTNNGVSYRTGTETRWEIVITEVALQPNFDTAYADFDEVLAVRQQVQENTSDFEITGDTDYEKCKSIYQSIISITDYDTTAPYAHGVAGVLYDTKAVCEGYAKTFKLLCDREGIPCLSILGNYNAEALTAHMWNYVYLDGAWYGCDCTFDESTEKLTYFMRGSEFFNTNHRPESPYSIMTLSFPEISVQDYITAEETTTSTTTTTTTTTTTETTTSTTYTETAADTTVIYTTDTPYTTDQATETTISSTSATTTSDTTVMYTSDTPYLPHTTMGSTTDTSESVTETTTESTTESDITTTTATTVTTTETTATTTEAEPEIYYGDVNSDSSLTLIDVVLLRKFLVNQEIDVQFSDRFDSNNDGKVNIFDAIYLLKFLIE